MIIIRAHTEEQEQAIAATIEQALKDQDVEILQSDETEMTMEDIISVVAYNAKQLRIYTGRLERNTRNMDQSWRKMEQHLAIIASYFNAKIIEQGDDPRMLIHLLQRREQIAKMEEMHNPPRLGERAENNAGPSS